MDEKLSAVCTYLTSPSMVATAKSVGINRKTLVQWKTTDWWDTEQTRLQHEKAEQHRHEYSKIVDKAQKQIFTKLPEATAAQAIVIAGIATDKIRLSDNMPTSISGDQGTSEAIKALADEFKALSDAYKAKDVKVIDEQ